MLSLIFFAISLVSASTTTPPALSCSGVGSTFSIWTNHAENDYLGSLTVPYSGSINTAIYFNDSVPSVPFKVAASNQIPAVFELRADCSLYYKSRRINVYNTDLMGITTYGAWTLNNVAINVTTPTVTDIYSVQFSNITTLSFSYDTSTGALTVIKAGQANNVVGVLQGYLFAGFGLSTRGRPSLINIATLQTLEGPPSTIINDIVGGRQFTLTRVIYIPDRTQLPIGLNGTTIVLGSAQTFTLNKQSYLTTNGRIVQIPKNGGTGIVASSVQSGYDPVIVNLRNQGGVAARLKTNTLGDLYFNPNTLISAQTIPATFNATSDNGFASTLDFFPTLV